MTGLTVPASRWPTVALLVALLTTAGRNVGGQLCGNNDVRTYGVKANGNGDDAPALLAADASPTSTHLFVQEVGSNTRWLCIRQSITLNKPLVLGDNMNIVISDGVVLSLRGQPAHHRRFPLTDGPLFQGQVQFVPPASNIVVLPEWFMTHDEYNVGDMVPALNRLKQACSQITCTIAWTPNRNWNFNSAFTLTPNLEFWSADVPGIQSTGPNSNTGFIFAAGDYKRARPYIFPHLGGFKAAIQTAPKGAVRNLRVHVSEVGNCKDSLLLKGNVVTSTFEFGTHQLVNNPVAVAAKSLDRVNVFSGFAGNNNPGPNSYVEFRTVPVIKKSKVTFGALDGITNNPNVAIVRNSALTAINNFKFEVTAWSGGFNQAVVWGKGKFNNLYMYVKASQALATSMSGSNNIITLGSTNPTEVAMPIFDTASGALGSGTIIITNYQRIYLPFDYIPPGFDWPVGAERVFYIQHGLLTGGTRRIILQPGPIDYGALSVWINPGITARGEPAGGKLLRIILKNSSNSPINRGTFASWPGGYEKSIDWRLIVAAAGIGA